MSSLGSPNPFFIAGKKAYEVKRSLRFNDNDSAYLRKSDYGSPDSSTTFTFSAWIKRANLDVWIPIAGSHSGSNAFNVFGINPQNELVWRIRNSSSVDLTRIESTQVLRDPSAWYHVLLERNSTLSTAGDRAKLYINGVRVTDFSQNTKDSQNLSYSSDFLTDINIGRFQRSSSTIDYGDFYLAEYHYIDGQAYDPSYFTETDPITGQLIPKKYTGGYGSNGFYLNFSTDTLGTDRSGNGNNFTPNNFSVAAGEGNDSVTDTPTNNFCTLNPLDRAAAITTQNGNLQIANASTGNYNGIRASFGSKTGKYYWEIKFPNTGYITGIGIARADGRIDNGNQPTYRIVLGLGSWFASYNSDNVNSYVNANPTSDYGNWSGASNYSANDIYMIAVDFDAGKIWWGKNGSWFSNSGTANPSTGTDPRHTFTVGNQWFPYSQEGDSSSCNQSYNFGQQGFAYTPPSGFVELSSANLPDPTILLPNKHFAAFTYTGTGSSGDVVNITNSDVDFIPDWVWVKTRSVSNDHILSDSVRGGTKYLVSSETYAEQTDTDKIRAFIQNGFESGTDGDTNWPSRTFVAWNWNAGNTDGKTYTVTVVSDSGNKYRFDGFGTSAVTLDLAEGGTYIFNYPSAHPFRFSTTSDGTHGGGTEYTTGVTHNSSTQVTIVVAASAPTLYYYCSSHSGMGGQVNTNSTLGSSNFDGSTQTIVKANTTAGFSIVSYTGNDTSGSTIGHGLGAIPQITIIKRRIASEDWMFGIGHILGSGKEGHYIKLNATEAEGTGNGPFASTNSSSTVVTIGGDVAVNDNGEPYISYCLSEVAGYSKFDKYTGNGSSDGTFVFTGFKPALLIVKRTDTSANWVIWDNKRSTFNPIQTFLYPNASNADGTGTDRVDFVSNGFKWRDNNSKWNASGGTFIYLAFAESPFKNARAR